MGGDAGGGSFGIFLYFPSAPSSVPVISENSLFGGHGGAGGLGRYGGKKGSGGNWYLGGYINPSLQAGGIGGTGGQGGDGGYGGGGAGGCGGVSYLIYAWSANDLYSSYDLSSANTLAANTGNGGAKGLGSGSVANFYGADGCDGPSDQIFLQP